MQTPRGGQIIQYFQFSAVSLTIILRSQLCINSAIVYMHRFYMFHSFVKFHRNLMAPCCLFLACKVEEQPRKLEYLLKVSWSCINKEGPTMDVKSEVSSRPGRPPVLSARAGLELCSVL